MSVILEILGSEAGTRKNTPDWSEKIATTGEFPWEKTIPFGIQTEELCIGKGKGKSVAKSTDRPLESLLRSEKGSIDWSKGHNFEKEKGYREGLREEKGSLWERQRKPSWEKVRLSRGLLRKENGC